MHSEPRDDVFGDGPIGPANASSPFGIVLIVARDDVDGFSDDGGIQRLTRTC